jgi:drug/metabolite transporter (DMT)-like permease
MPLAFLGEGAALATASCWAVGSLLFARAARRLGAFTLNQARITLALVILSAILLASRGVAWVPPGSGKNIAILIVSGLCGLTLGDWAFFRALVYLGPRQSTLFMTLAPPMAAALAFPLLGESLGPTALVGMALTLGGVVWVVRERGGAPVPPGHRIRGAVLGVLAAMGQGVGLVLSKIGMSHVIDPLPATAIRMAGGAMGVWALALAAGKVGQLRRLQEDRHARWATLGATLLGPVFGIWLSLVAVRFTDTGIAATLMATTPVLVLPLVMLVEKERVTIRALLGALVSVTGVAMLVLR